VDDEYDISGGFKVDSFNDDSQALENFMTGLYDLVILDVKMPGMRGFRLYSEIRKVDGNVSICFLTAADEFYYETLEKCHPNLDENCIIHKPVDNESLLKQIRSILQTSQLRRKLLITGRAYSNQTSRTIE